MVAPFFHIYLALSVATFVNRNIRHLLRLTKLYDDSHAQPIFGTDATKSLSILKASGTLDAVYGPIDCRKLVMGQVASQDGCGSGGPMRDAGQCIDNADSYAWLATVSLVACLSLSPHLI